MEPLKIALGEYGTKETAGKLHNAEVMKYARAPGLSWVKDDETAWCAIFVNWCLWKAKRMTTGQALARSFLTYGHKTTSPNVGDIAVFWRISPTSQYGHVGFFIKQTKDLVYVLGGNQSDMVNITAFPKNQLLMYRTIPKALHA